MNPAEAGGRIKPRPLFLQCFALVGFALAQPLYDQLGPNPTFFVAHHSSAWQIVSMVLVVSFALPVLLASLLLGIGRLSARHGYRTWLSIIGLLATVVLLPPSGMVLAGSPWIALSMALSGGVLFAVSYHRFAAMRLFLSVLAAAALVFPLTFLTAEPVRQLLAGPGHELASGGNNGAPVVMVVFDELPLTALLTTERTINRERYPNFAALADHAHFFRNASTVSHFTDIAVPALLTGRYPAARKAGRGAPAPVPANFPRNLFSMLAETHEIRAFESVTALAPAGASDSRFFGLGWERRQALFWLDSAIVFANRVVPRGLCPRLPTLNAQWLDFAGLMTNWMVDGTDRGRSPDGRAKQVQDFITAIGSSESPAALFLHVLLPHVPLVFLPSGAYYGPQPVLPHGMGRSRWGEDAWQAQQGYQRLLLQLGYVDRLLGEIIERLRDQGLYDGSLLIVTSDHGESYREGTSPRKIDDDNLADTLLVPLLVKLPGQVTGSVSDRNVETIDILPTVTAVLEGEPGWEFDGTDLFSDGPGRHGKRVFSDDGGLRVLPGEVPGVDAALQRKRSLFGSGDWEGVFAIGPSRGLHGQALSQLQLGEPAPFGALLERAVEFRSFRSEDGLVPAHLRGQLTGSPGVARQALAIALNGSVVATTYSFLDEDGTNRFAAMLPEHGFQEGFNRVDVLQVLDAPGAPRLHPVLQMQRNATIRLGEVLSFGRADFDPRYLLGGLSKPERRHSWSDGRAVRFEFAIVDAHGDVAMKARVFPYLRQQVVPLQTVEVLVNGELVDTWLLDQPVQSERTTIIPARFVGEGNFLLEFRLPQAVTPRHVGLGGDRRMLGISFLSLGFFPADEAGSGVATGGIPASP